MSNVETTIVSLETIARRHLGRVHKDLPTAVLVEEVVRRGEGHLSASGGVAIRQGQHTERALDSTYVVAGSAEGAGWLVGERIAEIPAERFEALSARLLAYLQGRDVYVQDIVVGGVEGASLRGRILAENAWHALVARTLYRPDTGDHAGAPHLTVIHAPGFAAVPERDGTRGVSFTIFHPARALVYVCGTAYAGELRNAVTGLAGALSSESALPLRAAVSADDADAGDGDGGGGGGGGGGAALFLGRTGTGKTALALDGERRLVADHAVFWTPQGLVGYERGAYATVLGLEPASEPAIGRATGRFGTVLENVALDRRTRRPDFADASLAVNTRAVVRADEGPDGDPACGHPRHVFLLTRDTAGVLPPIARLTPDQAVFAFLISYTSSLADTEAGQRDVRPDVEAALGDAAAAVSPAAVSPAAYASRFLERIGACGATCWFVNTGWVGEPADRAERVDLGVTRAVIRAALGGELDDVEMERDPLFLFEVPRTCPGVDPALLNPRDLAEDPAEYEIRANVLATAFIDAFSHFEQEMPASVAEMVDSVVLFPETLDVLEKFRLSF